MQESLFNTVQKLQSEEKINVEELELILSSDIEEVVSLCKKACLKPKTDSMGNAYFTKNDVDILKKMKELYAQSQSISQTSTIETAKEEKTENTENTEDLNKKVNFLTKAKNRLKSDSVVSFNNQPLMQVQKSFATLENNLVTRMSALLSEKMDGFDEIIVELVRSKTENENLRQQVSNLNKQLYILKKELASFNPLPFGLYKKIDNDDEI